MIQGIGEPERRIKRMQFQRGNNGGHGVWCSYAGHENDLVDDGINHTFVALNVNEDMFGCFFCIFNNSVNIKPSHPLPQTEWSAVICSRYRVISADWSNNIWNVTGVFLFILFLYFFLFFWFFSCVFVVMSEHKVKMEFILWYHLPVQTSEMLTQGDITLVSVLRMPPRLSFPVSSNLQLILWQEE